MSWAELELEEVDLGDQRRNRRLIQLVERLGDNPTASIPQACEGWSETHAAYRLLRGEGYDEQDLLEPHRQRTQQRMATHPVVLCLQDTTELNFNGRQSEGLGPLSYEAQRGMYVHPTYAVTPEREPLGVLDAWMWAREPKEADGSRPGVKESERWKEGYARLAELAPDLPETQMVYLADREADILDLMIGARDRGTPVDWLLRAQHNRALPNGQKLWSSVRETPALGELHFTLPAGRRRRARPVHQQIHAQRVALSDRQGGEVEATCLIATEIGAPQGVEPIEWRLLTNRPVETLEQAAELIEWYRARWEIEMLFGVFKQACQVEALQLGPIERLERALVLFLIISWRIDRLMRLGRQVPDLQADLMLEPEEWQAAYLLAKKPVPDSPPRLNDVLRLIAGLGGFLGRKGDGEPGVKTIWRGLLRVMDFADGFKYAKQAQGN